MTKFPVFLACLFSLLSLNASAQKPDTLVKKLDSLVIHADSVGGKQKNDINPATYNDRTKITVKSYIILLVDDFKQQLASPFRATVTDWIKIGGFATVLAGTALFVDKPVHQAAINLRNSNKTIVSISTYVTDFGGLYEGYTLAAFAAYGYIFKNEKTKTTTFLATQAYLTAGAIATVAKYLTGRQRPSYGDSLIQPNNIFHGPFFALKKGSNGSRPPSSAYTSFPSGHTTVAFAAATVFAMEYKNIRWVPYFAYSIATLIGASRIIQNAHWASDVIAGAALGFLCGRQVVNNYHRYSKIQSGIQKKKTSLTFTLNYNYGTLMPGLIYKF